MNATLTTALHIDYVPTATLPTLLADHYVLAVFGFGADAPHAADPRYVRVPLEPYGNASLEVWRSNTPTHVGCKDGIAWASNGQLQFGTIALEENTQPIDICSEQLYTRLTHFVAGSSTPHLLRIWNYVDGITIGTGDNERYRKFQHWPRTWHQRLKDRAAACCNSDRLLQRTPHPSRVLVGLGAPWHTTGKPPSN